MISWFLEGLAFTRKRKRNGEQVVLDEEGKRLLAEKEAVARKLHGLNVERDRARVTLSKFETEIEKLATEMAKRTRQRDECLEKEENLEEEVEAAQRALDLVQQRMVQRNLPPLPKEIYLEIAKHVHEREALAFAMTCRASRDAMKEALKERKGSTQTSVKWLTSSQKHYKTKGGVPVSREWIKWAYSMKWEYSYKSLYNDEDKEGLLPFLAGRGGFKDVLVWLKSEGCVLDINACWGAALGGHIKMLKYLKSEGVAFDKETCRHAARGGHLKVLKYLRSEGVSFDSSTSGGAAQGGYINVLKYLKTKGASFDKETCRYAAYSGHIDVLKYLKSEGVAFNSWASFGAAIGGQIDVLKYLRNEGTVFSSFAYDGAANGGHVDALKYLKSQGAIFDQNTCESAACAGHRHVLDYLESIGVTFDEEAYERRLQMEAEAYESDFESAYESDESFD